MEDVLDVYCGKGYDDEHPLICMDEAAKQLLGNEQEPLPAQPGVPAREDYHYQRHGVQALFVFFDPIKGQRRVSCRDSRTRLDWAEEVRLLLEEDYPQAKKVTLVCDNLNTHHIASLYLAFPAEQAQQLARRLEIHYTPKNGSWLNMAEIELSVLARQCLSRRIKNKEELAAALRAWQDERNASASRVHWRFTTADARIKLAHLYPQC
jgi:hypothetical protein